MDFAVARRNMVECQLRTNKVTDERLLSAVSELPREAFVPSSKNSLAYIDEDLEVSKGRYLMEPMAMARLIQAVQISENDSVLVIGAATGYMSAVAGKLGGPVFALESQEDLAADASRALTDLALDNVVVVDGVLNAGCPAHAPFDVILFQGAVEEIPTAILDQLNEGGRMGAVIGTEGSVGRASLFWKQNGVVSDRVLFDANIKNLPGFEKPKGFEF
ncbi:protein-L-isoaspartate O-methyltransferase family protein [Aestuariispira insulae]|uniref:Protein-L-isoaspartate O-methyltransferase n=1 Tax=Aestuariispira insulae TaxID=1461337 RepID=A0A3D9HNY6_9PROT|nr:protein-L-isoaspartate O-methyltransferase [Aestuariispira insulae]RED51021.1 protein-L-isoaspartate(D-aspartate) O-methyltransferase [Aestuariispira insulae]